MTEQCVIEALASLEPRDPVEAICSRDEKADPLADLRPVTSIDLVWALTR